MSKETNIIGLVLYEGETQRLYELCLQYQIPITYPTLFEKDEPYHPLWAFNEDGIGLIGTHLMWNLSKDGKRIIYGVNKLEIYLSNTDPWNKHNQ